MPIRRVEEAAVRVRKSRQDLVHQGAGGDEPSLVERGLIQGEQPVREVRVVLEDAAADAPPVLPRSSERTIGREEAGNDRLGGARGGDPVPVRLGGVGGRQGNGGIAERRDREPVPGRERLVVAGGLRPLGSALEEALTQGPEPLGDLGGRAAEAPDQLVVAGNPAQDRGALPVAGVGHAVGRFEETRVVGQQPRGSRRRST